MNRWKVILATLVIFASGLATGYFIVQKPVDLEPAAAPRLIAPGTSAPPATPLPNSWQAQQKEFARKLNNEVTLSPEQKERIDAAFKESHERTKAIRDRIAPELREEVKRVREQIRTELTPEQQVKFDAAMKKPARKDREDKPEEKRRRVAKDISKGEESSQPAPKE